MKKVVINTCYGGFSLSRAALTHIAAQEGKQAYFFEENWNSEDSLQYVPCKENDYFLTCFSIPNPNEAENSEEFELFDHSRDRECPLLIKAIEELGADVCSGPYAELKIVEIPDDVEYMIEDYDGAEHIAEVHRTWY